MSEDVEHRLAKLEGLVRRAYDLLWETDHRIPDKQVLVHNHVAEWRRDLEIYVLETYMKPFEIDDRRAG